MTHQAQQAVLILQHLRKRYAGEKPLLDIAQFALHTGEAIALTGQNGSGKTTLLRILAGLEPAEQGKLVREEHTLDCEAFPAQYPQAWRRQVLYVHQQPYMLRGTVRANIEYGLRAWRCSDAEMAERTAAALKWAQLETHAAQDAKTLSGGEKQRVALARAHALAPQVWLLDEPTANLDGASREQVIALIHALVHSGAALMIATHDRDLLDKAQLTRVKLQDGKLHERDS